MFLDIEAGSSGRPDQARELQNFERLAPILMQIPGIAPNFLAKEAISRMDDSIDLEDAIADGQPSIMAQNAVQPGASAGPPGSQPPGAQGPQGSANAPKPPGAATRPRRPRRRRGRSAAADDALIGLGFLVYRSSVRQTDEG